MRGALVLVGLATAFAGFAPAAAGNVGSSPGSMGSSLPGALVWGSGVFTSRADFENWLQARGQNLNGWSALHPRARRILIGAEAPPVRFKPGQFAPRSSPPTFLSSGTSDAGSPLGPIVAMLVVVGLLLVLLAALPFPVFAPEWAPGAVVYHHRITLLTVGAILVGAIAIARLVA